MNKIAIAFLSKENVTQSEQTILPLLNQPFDLFHIDGSKSEEGLSFFHRYDGHATIGSRDIFGGPDAAVAFALTKMLADPEQYTHVGLCEQDVLLPADWFTQMMALFEIGEHDGLSVGAVSARAYVDRILFQRNGYAVMHNLGFGQQIMTRQAAQLALKYLRTGYTLENRRTFCNLSGVDIAPWWAFKNGEHPLCGDWHQDLVLAAHGLASVALTPSSVEMIGQTPPLAEQGLTLATGPVEARRNDQAFELYVQNIRRIREQKLHVPISVPQRDDAGTCTYFAHQVFLLEDASYDGHWYLRFSQGFGPFAWKSGKASVLFNPQITVTISGTCEFLVSGGEKGGQVLVEDLLSGYSARPVLPAESATGGLMSLSCPGPVLRRSVRLTALSSGICFFGIRCREPQPEIVGWSFDHSVLPKVQT